MLVVRGESLKVKARGLAFKNMTKWLRESLLGFQLSKSLTVDLIFIFTVHFILIFFSFYFSFSIFGTTRVKGYQSRCHISHKLMA